MSLYKNKTIVYSEGLRVALALLSGALKKLKYRLLNKNIKIGSSFRAYTDLRIKGPGRVIIGDKVSIDLSFLRIPTIITHSKDAVVRIGNGCYLGGLRISCVNSVTIGDEVLMGSTTVMDSDIVPHRFTKIDKEWIDKHSTPVKIGSHVWTGTNSFVLRGSILHDEVVLGSGSVVREKEVEARTLLLGNPARKVGVTNG